MHELIAIPSSLASMGSGQRSNRTQWFDDVAFSSPGIATNNNFPPGLYLQANAKESLKPPLESLDQRGPVSWVSLSLPASLLATPTSVAPGLPMRKTLTENHGSALYQSWPRSQWPGCRCCRTTLPCACTRPVPSPGPRTSPPWLEHQGTSSLPIDAHRPGYASSVCVQAWGSLCHSLPIISPSGAKRIVLRRHPTSFCSRPFLLLHPKQS